MPRRPVAGWSSWGRPRVPRTDRTGRPAACPRTDEDVVHFAGATAGRPPAGAVHPRPGREAVSTGQAGAGSAAGCGKRSRFPRDVVCSFGPAKLSLDRSPRDLLHLAQRHRWRPVRPGHPGGHPVRQRLAPAGRVPWSRRVHEIVQARPVDGRRDDPGASRRYPKTPDQARERDSDDGVMPESAHDADSRSNRAGVAFRQCGEYQSRSLRRLEPFPALAADAEVPKARFLV